MRQRNEKRSKRQRMSKRRRRTTKKQRGGYDYTIIVCSKKNGNVIQEIHPTSDKTFEEIFAENDINNHKYYITQFSQIEIDRSSKPTYSSKNKLIIYQE